MTYLPTGAAGPTSRERYGGPTPADETAASWPTQSNTEGKAP
jgi:hypothetical protein